jgi:predicted  nucleic acid-binding Zn-ribbon protein
VHPIHATVDIVVDFADQFVRLEAENAQLRNAAKSSADQVQEANMLIAEARNENVSLKEELRKLKRKMKEEQELKLKAYAEVDKKEGALRKSIESLLRKIFPMLIHFFFF